ncbi:hypothetical protein L7F22_058604 [Adiantum nelumboides]|nr:hypothetical protein [Adiantum nelumboides]
MMMGKKVGDVQQLYGRHADLNRLIDELLRLLGIFYVGDFIPWLSWLDPRHELQSMKATGVQAKALMQQIIEERRHIQPPRASPQDFLDVLLAACADPNNATPLTEENIMGLILDFFAAGSDSSSIAVEWALANLINNPIAIHKLHEELDLVIGKKRLVVESDIKNLPYLRSVMQESMRIHPVGPFILRESIQECQIGLYKVPAKSRVFVNLWAIGRDSTTWERPLDFWPERFDNNKLDLRSKTFEMLPFGAGRRGCPGWALGFANIHLMLATLIQVHLLLELLDDMAECVNPFFLACSDLISSVSATQIDDRSQIPETKDNGDELESQDIGLGSLNELDLESARQEASLQIVPFCIRPEVGPKIVEPDDGVLHMDWGEDILHRTRVFRFFEFPPVPLCRLIPYARV